MTVFALAYFDGGREQALVNQQAEQLHYCPDVLASDPHLCAGRRIVDIERVHKCEGPHLLFDHADENSTTTGPVSTQESFDVTFHTFMGGVRVRAPQRAALVPFGQVLFGGEHDSSVDDRTITVFQNVVPSRREGTSSNAALALDAGVTAAVGSIGARASVGYVRLFSEADSDAFRFSLGGVFQF